MHIRRSIALAAGLCAAGLWLLPGLALAQVGLGNARYFKCQIMAREATLIGLEERAALLATRTNAAALSAAGERSRLRVDLAFQSCGFSSAELAAYAQSNGDDLRSWLASHPTTQGRMQGLQAQIHAVAARMPTAPVRPAPLPR